ncbi:MAG: DNA mismatch repair protein MutS [Muribaculaceae bacterium]|nr:DNA mismatch repair protein MutS [Muribaculaceae bacterium]
MAKTNETPLMKQYYEMKKKHPDAILLFRVGDFYETFADDAKAASDILGITLTSRGKGYASEVALAGFPHHALDTYLPKLVRAGRRVAICEQLEDPKTTNKLVKRGITELVTPGLNPNDATLPPRENNFLAGLYFPRTDLRRNQHTNVGVAFLDLTTGEFLCSEGDMAYIDKLLNNIAPKEVLRMRGTRRLCEENINYRSVYNELDEWVYTYDAARERLLAHFGTDSLKGFGVENMESAIIAAGSLIHYLDYTNHCNVAHITTLGRIDADRYVRLDRFTIRNLELTRPSSPDGMSLLQVLDRTVTPMGTRRLHFWVNFPLLDIDQITERQDCIEYMYRDPSTRSLIGETLRTVGDLERLGSSLGQGRIGPRALLTMRDSLRATANLRRLLISSECDPLRRLGTDMADCTAVIDDITRTVSQDAPALLNKGNVIAPGVNAELDELRDIALNGRDALASITEREIEATGITSLKIGFNNVFGYYIEVRNTHKDKVPANWIRKQTLVNAERYITPELKEYEQKILGAQERIDILETEEYNKLLARLALYTEAIHSNARSAATADVYMSLADVAEEYGYVRPIVNDSLTLKITNGRHPVIERRLPPGEPYIANSVTLECDGTQIIILTGPNMSGKSALLRQTALIVIMAQMGSFVPAEAAEIGIIDKVFTRVGASDNISSGESTFMVEMNEAAAILNNMSQRSLILFDELGRGTSTYDGISIAWAIVEHIHENGRCRPKTLFATHYHELNEMEKDFRRIVNYNVSVREIDGKVVFVRKIERGGSAHSFGIHVAKLAGLPPSIVKRADQVLGSLEKSPSTPAPAAREGYQMSIFQLDDPMLEQIREALLGISIDNLTPLQALQKLHELQSLLTGK